jgi:hypothetical protein
MERKRIRHWPEAVVLATGALPVVAIWLHAYSHTPSWHPEPTWSHTLILVATTTAAAIALAWLLRRRLLVLWWLLVLIALTGPPAVVATGVIRIRVTGSEAVSTPVVAALAAGSACVLATLLLALVPMRRRAAPLLLPLTLALIAGHAVSALPGRTEVSLALRVGYPYPTSAAMQLIYGHQIES